MANHTITRINPKVILISSIMGIPMATNTSSSNTAAQLNRLWRSFFPESCVSWKLAALLCEGRLGESCRRGK